MKTIGLEEHFVTNDVLVAWPFCMKVRLFVLEAGLGPRDVDARDFALERHVRPIICCDRSTGSWSSMD
jgi:hypothetical protein